MKRTKNDRSDRNRQLTAEELKRVSGSGETAPSDNGGGGGGGSTGKP